MEKWTNGSVFWFLPSYLKYTEITIKNKQLQAIKHPSPFQFLYSILYHMYPSISSSHLPDFFMYRVSSESWPCFSGTLLKVTLVYIRYFTIAHTGQVTFYKEPQTHGHV